MPISWKTSDGNTGIAENDYEFAMQHSNTSTKGDREELAPQDRINQAFGEGPAAPEIKDQNAPYSWGMGDDLKGLGGQPDAPADEWQKAYGDKRAGEFIPIKIERAERSGLNSRYPTETDRSISQGNDLSYGDPSAGYFDNFRLNAKVRSIGKYDLADRVNANEPLNDKLEPITYDKSNELHRAWLAARKSGLATIGFDPHVSIGSPDDGTQLTLGGLYRRKDDTIWYDSSMPDALVHESMHRGYAKLKEEGIVPKNSIYDEETIVRALIQKHLGDVELSGKDNPTAGDKQVLAGKDMLERHGDYLDRLESDAAKYYATKRGKKSTELEPTMHEQLALFQERLNNTPPEEAGAFRKFLGSLNIMPAPGKPESEWTAKEHFGVLLNTAMAGMGGGYRMPRMTGPGIGARPPASFDYPMDFKDYYPANNMNKPSGQIDQPGLDAFVNNAWEGLRKQFTPGTYEHAVANQIAQKGKLKIVPKEENLTTETEPQLQQAQDRRVNWPEGWGVTKATGRALTEYPHVQKAFQEAVESGAKTTAEITNYMNLNGTTINPSTVQLLKSKAGLTGVKAEAWSADKNDTFMKLIGEGKTTPEIAKEMGITRSTVEGKLSRIKENNPDFERIFAPRETMATRLDSVRELAKQGLHANAIAEKIGKSSAYVRMLASTGDIELPRDPSSRGGGALKKAEKGAWQKALQDRLNQ